MLQRTIKVIAAAFIIVLGAISPGICVALKNISLEANPIALKYGGNLPLFMRWFADIRESILFFIWGLLAIIIIAGAVVEAMLEAKRGKEDTNDSFSLKVSSLISVSCIVLFLFIFILYFLQSAFYEYNILNVIVATK